MNIKLYQPGSILLQWHIQVVKPSALQCLIVKLFPLCHSTSMSPIAQWVPTLISRVTAAREWC